MKFRAVSHIAGRSLVELMVAMAIGLGMSIAVSSLYMASRSAGGASDSLVEVRNNGRLAIQLLSEQLRMAGYGDYLSGARGSRYKGSARTGSNSQGVGFAVNGCDGRFSLDSIATNGCKTSDATHNSLAIAYHGVASSSATGSSVDCLGNEAKPDPNTKIDTVASTYYVAVDTSGTASDKTDDIPSLYCLGTSTTGSPGPIIPGVEQFVVRYGVDTGQDFSVDRMMSATEIRSEMVETNPKFDFSNVQSVEICLLVRSTKKSQVHNMSEVTDCADEAVAADGYYRQRFKAIVMLRNKTYRP